MGFSEDRSRFNRPGQGILVAACLLAALLVLSGCSFSLAEDVPPPAGVANQSGAGQVAETQQPTAMEVKLPIVAPDPAQGAPIYAEECAPCHGVTGKGDGSQASQLPVAVPALAEPQRVRAARPVDWFNVVTYGRMDRNMPPFYNSLTDRQRWDVVAYLYTLGMPGSVLAQGQAIYAQKCQGCHGLDGKGDGGQAINWSDPTRLARFSPQELWDATRQGVPPNMPAFSAELDESQLWAVTAYIRSFSFAPHQAIASAAQDAAAGGKEVVTLSGKVSQGSGGKLPEGLVAHLQGFEVTSDQAAAAPVVDTTAIVQGDGSYAFPEVEVGAGRVYLVSVEYQGNTFSSDVLHSADVQPGDTIYLPVTVYDSSTDPSPLFAQRVHVFLDFSDPQTLSVVEVFIITNPTDRVIVPPAAQDGGTAPLLQFDLPQGAANLQFKGGELGGRFIGTAAGFGDRAGVLPGPEQHQVMFGYQLPYRSGREISLKMALPVESVMLAVPSTGVRVQSAQLQDAGQRTVQDMDFQFYTSGRLATGSTLRFKLSGQPVSAGAAFPTGNLANLLVGAGTLALVLALGGVWLYRRSSLQKRLAQPQAALPGVSQGGERPARSAGQPSAAPGAETTEQLLDSILALDDLYQEGKVPQELYQKRRSELKEKLKALSGKGK